MRHIDCDILVIGSGIAGLSYSVTVAEGAPDCRVAIITKKDQGESNTNYAQGGIASVMSPLDSFADHLADTLRAGAGLCDESIVRRVVEAGPAAIKRLTDVGVEFTESQQDASGYDLALEGGHSARRVVHAADLTGREIERALLARCRESANIEMYENHIAADIYVSDSESGPRVSGALVYDASAKEYLSFNAPLALLATGGVGQIYAHTTNPLIATGDGIAIAYRAGCAVANLEFVQFHPTAFYEDAERSLLISEAVRGHGGRLKTIAGRYFMQDYDERADLAPRDIVARAIDNELKKSGDQHVYLDVTHIAPEEIKERFPNIYQGCLDRGVDITKDPIPVVPSAHYLCGGVCATLEGITDIPGLLVCGETAHTGMHGANRLASNSLLEAVVMAQFAADWTLRSIPDFKRLNPPEPPAYTSGVKRSGKGVIVSHERLALKNLMSNYLGIVRSLERLELARERVQVIYKAVEREFSSIDDVYAAIELRNMAQVALLMIEMALSRHESRGLHYLLDYPGRDDAAYRRDSVIRPQRKPELVS